MVRVACIALAGLFILGCNASNPAGTSDGQSAESAVGNGAAPAPDDRAPGTHDRVELLIASLADNSEHPGGGLTAWTQLRDLGLDAFPEAAEHLEDDGFAFRADSGSTYDNWTVGRACRDLLWCNLEPYNKALLSSSIPEGKVWWRPVYTTEFLTKSADAKAWLAEHRGKQLVDLQIEVLEWVTTHRSDRDAEISAEDKASLVELLDQLKATRKPLPPAVPWAQ